MSKKLSGSMESPTHLFKLVQYMTYFVYNASKQNSKVTIPTILNRWFGEESKNRMSLINEFAQELEVICEPFLRSSYWVEEFKLDLTPLEIKQEIIKLINDHWLPI